MNTSKILDMRNKTIKEALDEMERNGLPEEQTATVVLFVGFGFDKAVTFLESQLDNKD